MANAARPEARSGAPTVVAPRALLVALRPKQWTKNGLLFVALAFTLNLQETALLVRSVIAFAAFCALSSAGYLLNDVLDVEADRRHPTKRLRPIASGQVPVGLALGVGLLLAAAGLLACFVLGSMLGILALAYVLLTAVYSTTLKHLVLLDIFGLAGGFVLRAAAGAVAIDVPISPWLYIATLLGALLIALGKRRTELQTLPAEIAIGHRRNLESYSLEFVDQLILVVSSAAVMTYALYTFSAENLPRNHSMMLTIPVVLYGLFRYLFLVHDGNVGGSPEDLLFRDRPLLASVSVWALLSVVILYLGRA
ncbi:MAG: decaprenyl-phosphate phosphoribosyltransferase [Chloroflexi bacterium]|nr:decaprenyl-phosphate phosphoribosyltransferase [Chloroflexota bacterium]MBV9546323.1 decaprenyl-phosphate phosphoribosyltransferase [Chloroflexota bacterium]